MSKEETAEILPLFPSFLYKTNLENNKEDREKFLELLKSPSAVWKSGNENLFCDDSSTVNEAVQSKFFSSIVRHLSVVQQEILQFNHDLNLIVTEVWFAKTKPGKTHGLHSHPNSIVSGVYYLHATESMGGLRFMSPHVNGLYINNRSGYNQFNATSNDQTPKSGDLYIFPSYLHHSVLKNDSEEDRYIMSFNTYVKGKVCDLSTSRLII